METIVRTDQSVLGDGMSAASWASIAAGAVATAALTLALLALGAGLGLSSISPWADFGRLGRDLQDRDRDIPRAGRRHGVRHRRLLGRPAAHQVGRP